MDLFICGLFVIQFLSYAARVAISKMNVGNKFFPYLRLKVKSSWTIPSTPRQCPLRLQQFCWMHQPVSRIQKKCRNPPHFLLWPFHDPRRQNYFSSSDFNPLSIEVYYILSHTYKLIAVSSLSIHIIRMLQFIGSNFLARQTSVI